MQYPLKKPKHGHSTEQNAFGFSNQSFL